ncbi:MAG: hypothetical protein E7271_00310 [Lachnospiraceae bacterium]|nr:hypothetical protein [Lachnospiraceae bacterium]
MRYNFNDEKWDIVEVKGVRCLFCDIRIDRNTIPEGMIMYEVDEGDTIYLSEDDWNYIDDEIIREQECKIQERHEKEWKDRSFINRLIRIKK